MSDKFLATQIAWSLHGLPYIWGGDDPVLGFDCSGFVIEILKSCGTLPLVGDWRAKDLYKRFKDKKTDIPELGCLVFWGKTEDTIYHVEFCLNEKHSMGASGGGSKTISREDAIKQNAYIKVRPFSKRRGIFGFVNPFEEI